ncbi:uncharacterized protein MONOS_5986 [Monocercomonoides exilis]|uniref:uncharacterized protein n=1 Tax=Monocercomonoides exilis TaxID=2049356 RepID=UPI00355A2556|nr:hypothetical protein MONOS_5986 [Monocercomonoides exilis]|eukprot:MONOS_5986.1-p1 / transcript=MONOS_5986.1 / gene=MONOS_5986 / organism=Monocercomonoides_exilis_PA203 / gene_product=unspecified product / transcript_product=unspecified product / location=Mono_scaffold00182:23370-27379(+) / protein_length=1101 / sequence_SO=supercontig / SO=protein_coding / is_pseudo=false
MLFSQESFSNAKNIAVVQSIKYASVHRIEDFEQLYVLTPRTGNEFVNSCFSVDGTQLYCCEDDGIITIYSVETGAPVKSFSTIEENVKNADYENLPESASRRRQSVLDFLHSVSRSCFCINFTKCLVFDHQALSLPRTLTLFPQIPNFLGDTSSIIKPTSFSLLTTVNANGNVTISLDGSLHLATIPVLKHAFNHINENGQVTSASESTDFERTYKESENISDANQLPYLSFIVTSIQVADDLSSILINVSNPVENQLLYFDSSVISANIYPLHQLHYMLNCLTYYHIRIVRFVRYLRNEWVSKSDEWKSIILDLGKCTKLHQHKEISASEGESKEETSDNIFDEKTQQKQFFEAAADDLLVLMTCGPVTDSLQNFFKTDIQQNIIRTVKSYTSFCDALLDNCVNMLEPCIESLLGLLSDLIGTMRQPAYQPFQMEKQVNVAYHAAQNIKKALSKFYSELAATREGVEAIFQLLLYHTNYWSNPEKLETGESVKQIFQMLNITQAHPLLSITPSLFDRALSLFHTDTVLAAISGEDDALSLGRTIIELHVEMQKMFLVPSEYLSKSISLRYTISLGNSFWMRNELLDNHSSEQMSNMLSANDEGVDEGNTHSGEMVADAKKKYSNRESRIIKSSQALTLFQLSFARWLSYRFRKGDMIDWDDEDWMFAKREGISMSNEEYSIFEDEKDLFKAGERIDNSIQQRSDEEKPKHRYGEDSETSDGSVLHDAADQIPLEDQAALREMAIELLRVEDENKGRFLCDLWTTVASPSPIFLAQKLKGKEKQLDSKTERIFVDAEMKVDPQDRQSIFNNAKKDESPICQDKAERLEPIEPADTHSILSLIASSYPLEESISDSSGADNSEAEELNPVEELLYTDASLEPEGESVSSYDESLNIPQSFVNVHYFCWVDISVNSNIVHIIRIEQEIHRPSLSAVLPLFPISPKEIAFSRLSILCPYTPRNLALLPNDSICVLYGPSDLQSDPHPSHFVRIYSFSSSSWKQFTPRSLSSSPKLHFSFDPHERPFHATQKASFPISLNISGDIPYSMSVSKEKRRCIVRGIRGSCFSFSFDCIDIINPCNDTAYQTLFGEDELTKSIKMEEDG